MNIAAKIKTARQQAGLTQSELASSLPVTQGYLSLLESGRRMPSLRTLNGIAKSLNISASDLIKGV